MRNDDVQIFTLRIYKELVFLNLFLFICIRIRHGHIVIKLSQNASGLMTMCDASASAQTVPLILM